MMIYRCYTCKELYFYRGSCPKCGNTGNFELSLDGSITAIYQLIMENLFGDKLPSIIDINKKVMQVMYQAVEKMGEMKIIFEKEVSICLNCTSIFIEPLGLYEYYEEVQYCPKCEVSKLTQVKLKEHIDIVLSIVKDPDILFDSSRDVEFNNIVLAIDELKVLNLLNKESKKYVK